MPANLLRQTLKINSNLWEMKHIVTIRLARHNYCKLGSPVLNTFLTIVRGTIAAFCFPSLLTKQHSVSARLTAP